MAVETLRSEALQAVSQMLGMNKDIEGAHQQCEKYRLALKEIGDIIKDLKNDHNIKPQKIVGGSILLPVSNKSVIKELQERRKQIDISLKGIEEQIRHREDALMEHFHKVYVELKRKLPEDMR